MEGLRGLSGETSGQCHTAVLFVYGSKDLSVSVHKNDSATPQSCLYTVARTCQSLSTRMTVPHRSPVCIR